MRFKKGFALAIMLLALALIFTGVSCINGYSSQVTHHNLVSTESIVVAPDGYGYLSLQPNASQENYYCTIRISNGTIRETSLTDELYAAYLNGSYKATWHEMPTPVIAQSTSDYEETWPLNALTEKMNYIFWNPASPTSKEVSLTIYQEQTENRYNGFNLGLGIFLVASGAVSGLGAAFWVSKRTLLVVVAFTLIFSGIVVEGNFAQINHHQGIVSTYSLTLLPGDYLNESIVYEQPGSYAFMLTVKNGTIDSVVLSDEDFAKFNEGQYEPHWSNVKGSQGLSGNIIGNSADHVYLVLSNPDSAEKQVNIEVHHSWDAYNLVGLGGGISLIAGGITILFLANRSRFSAFNKALEEQT